MCLWTEVPETSRTRATGAGLRCKAWVPRAAAGRGPPAFCVSTRLHCTLRRGCVPFRTGACSARALPARAASATEGTGRSPRPGSVAAQRELARLSPSPRPRPYLLGLPAFFPRRGTSPLPAAPMPAGGRDSGGGPRTRAAAAGPPGAQGARLQTPRRGGGAGGAGPGGGQSAGEAAAGRRLAGPAGRRLPGRARCFEPRHPLAAPSPLQPARPKTRPGRAGSGGTPDPASTLRPPQGRVGADSVGPPAGRPAAGTQLGLGFSLNGSHHSPLCPLPHKIPCKHKNSK